MGGREKYLPEWMEGGIEGAAMHSVYRGSVCTWEGLVWNEAPPQRMRSTNFSASALGSHLRENTEGTGTVHFCESSLNMDASDAPELCMCHHYSGLQTTGAC